MSSEELARTIPVRPPMVKRKIKPKAQSIGGCHLIVSLCRVASQLKTFLEFLAYEAFSNTEISITTRMDTVNHFYIGGSNK